MPTSNSPSRSGRGMSASGPAPSTAYAALDIPLTTPQSAIRYLQAARNGPVLDPVVATHAPVNPNAEAFPAYDPRKVLRAVGRVLGRHDPSSSRDGGRIASSIDALATPRHGLSIIEHFAMLEQAAVAAMDCGDLEAAREYLAPLLQRFPPSTSLRTARLQGMFLEAQGDIRGALALYDAAILRDPGASFAIKKRHVAAQWSAGMRSEAIAGLVTYLDFNMQDAEGWQQLMTWYIEEGRYQQAAYCGEELILLRPQQQLYKLRYADILYALDRHAESLRYYCAVLDACPDHTAALMSLKLVTALLLFSTRPGADVASALTGPDASRLSSASSSGGQSSSPAPASPMRHPSSGVARTGSSGRHKDRAGVVLPPRDVLQDLHAMAVAELRHTYRTTRGVTPPVRKIAQAWLDAASRIPGVEPV